MKKFKLLDKNIYSGFTIIELLIVLAIAGLILAIIFIALPDLERAARNDARKHDAELLVSAINQCLSTSANNISYCEQASNVDLPSSELVDMTGFFYGAAPPTSLSLCGNSEYPHGPPLSPTATLSDPNSCAPSYNKMNYLFGLKCISSTTYGFASSVQFVVTYRAETGNGWINYCVS